MVHAGRGGIVLFAKAPVPGRVQTGMTPLLDPEDAARLHSAFVSDTLEMLECLAGIADIELWTDSETEAWAEFHVPRTVECEADPGRCTLSALDRQLASGRCPAIVIGSQAPTVPASHLLHLLRTRADVAFGPTEDGGFYAVACRRTRAEMFSEIVWSSPFTLETALDAVRRCDLTVELGPRWFQVDDARDLDRLRACRRLPRNTAQWFASWAG